MNGFSIQRAFRNARANTRVNTRGDTRGETVVGKCVPDIEVGKSTVPRDYRCAHLSGWAGRGYLSSQEASQHRGFSVFVTPGDGVVSFRVF